MSQIVTVAFDDADQADRMLDALKDLEREGLLKMEDVAAVVRDAQGKVSYRTTRDVPGAGAGALMGGLWGLLFGTILFVPLVGAAAGAALGALGGAVGKESLDEAYRQQINDRLRPDTSMLFLRVDDVARGDELLRRLRAEQFGGTVLRSNLSPEAERALQDALSSGAARTGPAGPPLPAISLPVLRPSPPCGPSRWATVGGGSGTMVSPECRAPPV